MGSTTELTPPRLEPGQVLLGRFAITRQLGEGGMGTVWLARHTALDMPVAIKVLAEPLDAESGSESHRRFVNEAKALARVVSDYVCRPLDFGQLETGQPYLVLEFLDATPLSVVQEKTPLSVRDCVDVVLQVAAGLAEAHRAGLIHRDVKPSNVLVMRRGPGLAAKLIDFGLSRKVGLSAQITATDRVVGTPLFMSPEQARRIPLDHRTDVWSLGVMLYWLLARRYPFEGSSHTHVLANILQQPHPSLSSVRPDLDVALVRAVDACLEKDAVVRMPWMGALAAALIPFAGPRGAVAAQSAMASQSSATETFEAPMRATAVAAGFRFASEPTVDATPMPAIHAITDEETLSSEPLSEGVPPTVEMPSLEDPGPGPGAVEFTTPKR